MDLGRFLERCERLQWDPDDLDWSRTPRPLSRADEIAVVQYFTNMAGIERLAKALFAFQREMTDEPILRRIFDTFVADEERHAIVAERLARHYDVHRYRRYALDPHLVRFARAFQDVLHHLSPEIANAYITAGEILLDIALLRSLDDYVDDAMSRQAMRLINRDESRHIAIDHRMVAYYASDAYQRWRARQPPKAALDRLRGAWAFARFLRCARPFLVAVFFEPMALVDPEGRRLIEAFRRIQLLGLKEEVQDRPFNRFLRTMQGLFNHPRLGPLAGPLVVRVVGVDPRALAVLTTEEDVRRLSTMSFADLAEETLASKEAARSATAAALVGAQSHATGRGPSGSRGRAGS